MIPTKPEDQQDHFVNFRHLEERIAALEAAHPEDLKDVAQHVTDIFVTLARQRAVNEALEKWWSSPEFEDAPDAMKAVVAALREAQK